MRIRNLQFAFLLALGFVVLAGAPASALRQVVERPVVPDSDEMRLSVIERSVLPDFDDDEYLILERSVVPDLGDDEELLIGEKTASVAAEAVHSRPFWFDRKLRDLGWLFLAWLPQQAK